MALANVETAKLLLYSAFGHADAASMGQGQINLLQFLLDVASSAIEDYVGYPLTYQSRVEYYSGNGMPDIVLKRFPTDSEAENEVRVDPLGAWGQRTDQFDSDSILVQGEDYAIVTEQGDSKGKAGLLRRLGMQGAFGTPGASSGWGYGLFGGRGTLTPIPWHCPNWTPGEGNIKVTYYAGFASDAIPPAIQQAAMSLTAWMKRFSPFGGLVAASEGLGEYNYSLAAIDAAQAAGAALAAAGPLGSTRQLLSRYRDMAA